MENNEIISVQTSDRVRKRNTGKKIFNGLLLYLHDFVFLIAGVLLAFSLLFRVVVVSGPSMNQTLVDGDWLMLIGNVLYRTPSHGDIVVVSKSTYDNGTPIIKRIIALEGQTVDIDFDAGIVYVDGKKLVEPYTFEPTWLQEGTEFPLTVNEGCVFVMGDNRNDSKDSRSPEIGQVDRREVLGKAVFLFFPGNNNGRVEREFNRVGVLSQ